MLGMSISVLTFILTAFVSILFVGFILITEGYLKLPSLNRTGDTSLGAQSVNWLGAMALIGAILICLI